MKEYPDTVEAKRAPNGAEPRELEDCSYALCYFPKHTRFPFFAVVPPGGAVVGLDPNAVTIHDDGAITFASELLGDWLPGKSTHERWRLDHGRFYRVKEKPGG